MTNKISGSHFEREFAEMLFNKGYWVHLMQQNSDGQPADIIACKKGKALLIDCKVCERDVFELSRMEENQINAMGLWMATSNNTPFFALKLHDNSIYVLRYTDLLIEQKQGKKSLNVKEIMMIGEPFEKWMMSLT